MLNIFYGIAAFIVGLFCLNLGYQNYRDISQLEKASETVSSEPITQYVKRTKGGTTRGYTLDVSFKTKSGISQHCSSGVPEALINQIQQKPVVNVRYATANPSNCQIEGGNEKGYGFVAILGLILTLGGAGYLYNRYSTR